MSTQIVKSAIRDHNQVQLEYYHNKIKKTMLPVDTYYVNRHTDKLVQHAGLKPTDSILEVGCGMGKFTFQLMRRGFKLTGLDLSPFMLQKLLEYNNNVFDIDLICSDILEIPEEYNEKYDHVIGFFTLHHFLQLETYFQAMKRTLKPGGKITFIEPNAYNPLYYVQIVISPGMTWKGDKGIAMMRRNRFKKAAEYAKLEDLQISKYGFFPPFVSNTSAGRKTENILEKIPVLKGVSAFQAITLTNPK